MKLSPALLTLIHIAWGPFLGLLISGYSAVGQYNAVHGINIEQDVIVFLLCTLTGLSSAGIAALRAIKASPALPVVEAEVESAATAKATQLAQDAHSRLNDLEANITNWLQAHLASHATTPTVAPMSAATPSALSPVRLVPMPDVATPMPVQSVPNVPPSGAVLSTTVPGMPVVQV